MSTAHATTAAPPVTADNFPRVESDLAIRKVHDQVGLSTILHDRRPTPLEDQKIIRMNRDTLYSYAILDLTEPGRVTLPVTDGRYMSLHVINQDHYCRVFASPGTYEIRQEDVGTRYAYCFFRTFVDMSDENDLRKANGFQDEVIVEGGADAPLDVPDWDVDEASRIRDALLVLSSTIADTSQHFGQPEQTTPIHHLIGAAMGWAGMPKENAMYTNFVPAQNDGRVPHVLTVRDVPVDAFWSVTVYNADGYIEPNERGVYAFNDRTAQPNQDGSYTIHFGGCDDLDKKNCLDIPAGWNYIFRMYEPRQEIIDGTWTVPPAVPVA